MSLESGAWTTGDTEAVLNLPDLAARWLLDSVVFSFATVEVTMANKSKDKKNQMPTGEGKKQSPRSGEAFEMGKRSEVMQAQRHHPELNMGTDHHPELNMGTDEDRGPAERSGRTQNPQRPKAGR
jgi:hypothetical protein